MRCRDHRIRLPDIKWTIDPIGLTVICREKSFASLQFINQELRKLATLALMFIVGELRFERPRHSKTP